MTLYKLFYDAKQINPRVLFNPFGEFLPRVGDELLWRVTENAVGPTHGNTKLVVLLRVDKVRFHIENNRDDQFSPKEIHISLSRI